MFSDELLQPANIKKASVAFILILIVLIGSVLTASWTQRDFGRVEVSDVFYRNYNGIPIRAKLFRPRQATEAKPAPGVVYIHGYQNNRETGDAYSIEMARRGFVVLNIDAIGRGHSGQPGDPKEADFDPTYGGKTSLAYLRSLPYVRKDATAVMGHSLGAEMAYHVALNDPSVRAVVLTGFAYTREASTAMPRNMLMIIGRYDEFRRRMTGTRDIEREWMHTEQTRRAFGFTGPEIGKTYGNFQEGTARRVYVPPITHVHESHYGGAIAETVSWLKASLHPDPSQWIDPCNQIWQIKELATLSALLAGFALLIPFVFLLISMPWFRRLIAQPSRSYACSLNNFLKFSAINGIWEWLYLPLILVLFGFHKYVLRIDTVFPMMMVNAIVWWFLWVNILGFLMLRRWFRRQAKPKGVTLVDLGVSDKPERLHMDGGKLGWSILLALLAFLFLYGIEYLSERLCTVNFRFVWPFLSELTPYRWCMFFLYFPFLLVCFLSTGLFLHGQIRRAEKTTFTRTVISRSVDGILALCVPIILFLCLQYIPLFTTGFIPFQGPGGLFVVFIINLFHILPLLAVTTVLSTWCFQLTGRIYTGAVLNALLIAWVFASSQVIAPIPV
ncbi:MAG: alpha/beta hydrolase [Deltaproteobacteria bacterium]|nr:alpha/beta hydrolase [Deltaproteobacteria bacterium]